MRNVEVDKLSSKMVEVAKVCNSRRERRWISAKLPSKMKVDVVKVCNCRRLWPQKWELWSGSVASANASSTRIV